MTEQRIVAPRPLIALFARFILKLQLSHRTDRYLKLDFSEARIQMKKYLLMVFIFTLVAAYPAWSQRQLPDGDAKEIVQSACIICHSLDRVFNANFGPKDWDNVVDMMLNNGAPVSRAKIPALKEYLTKSFPPRPWPPAVVVPGAQKVTFQEWTVPTPGSRPHDPMSAPDGSIWYAGQFSNVIGHLDP